MFTCNKGCSTEPIILKQKTTQLKNATFTAINSKTVPAIPGYQVSSDWNELPRIHAYKGQRIKCFPTTTNGWPSNSHYAPFGINSVHKDGTHSYYIRFEKPQAHEIKNNGESVIHNQTHYYSTDVPPILRYSCAKALYSGDYTMHSALGTDTSVTEKNVHKDFHSKVALRVCTPIGFDIRVDKAIDFLDQEENEVVGLFANNRKEIIDDPERSTESHKGMYLPHSNNNSHSSVSFNVVKHSYAHGELWRVKNDLFPDAGRVSVRGGGADYINFSFTDKNPAEEYYDISGVPLSYTLKAKTAKELKKYLDKDMSGLFTIGGFTLLDPEHTPEEPHKNLPDGYVCPTERHCDYAAGINFLSDRIIVHMYKPDIAVSGCDMKQEGDTRVKKN